MVNFCSTVQKSPTYFAQKVPVSNSLISSMSSTRQGLYGVQFFEYSGY